MVTVGSQTPGPAEGHAEAARRPELDITNADTWPEMLTVDELALILRSSTKAVRDLIASGRIEASRGAGRGFRISRRWVIANILH